jgi:hypothetical protein
LIRTIQGLNVLPPFENWLRVSTHNTVFGRGLVFSCFISCFLLKDNFFLVFYSNSTTNKNMKTLNYDQK